MSQIYKPGTGGGALPPEVATSYVTDDGTAIPAANILNVLGENGVVTSADPNGSNNLIISLQNSVIDQGQTINVQTIDLTTIDCSVAGTYFIEARVSAYTTAGNNGAGLSLYATVISTGAAATVLDDTDAIAHISPVIDTADLDYEFVASGTDAILQVTGVAATTINWGAFSVYVFRGL